MQDTLIIVNPEAGKGKGRKVYKKLLQLPFISEKAVLKKTDSPGHATKIVRSYASAYKNIIIGGGDGTVNEVFRGIDPNLSVNFAVLPIGTGNDFAMNLNKTKNYLKIVSDFFFKKNYELKKFGLYCVNFKLSEDNTIHKTRFVNALGVGFDGLVAKIVNENKKLSGVAAYVLGVFKALRQYEFLEVNYIVPKIDLQNKENLIITVGSGKTSGGGFYLNPNANIFEDYLSLTIIAKMSKLKVLKSLPLALINKIDNVKEALITKVSAVEIAFSNNVVAHCDGEILSDKINYVKVTPIKHNLKVISFK